MSLESNLKYEAARIYWEELSWKDRSYHTVLERLQQHPDMAEKLRGGNSQALQDKIGRMVRDWEAENKVSHSVLKSTETSDYFPMAPELEDRIRDKFGLRDVIVVDTRSISLPQEPPQSEAWNTYDDKIHWCLGYWGGRALPTLLRNGDVVGCGGGRGPEHTVDRCILPQTSSCHVSRVVSLSGSMSTREWSIPGRAHDLDPDNIAMRLKPKINCLEGAALVGCSITAKHAAPHVSGITIVLTGIGALAGRHRFRNPSMELKPVESLLKELNRRADQVDPAMGNSPFCHWVGDVCNSLFLVDDDTVPGLRLDKADRGKIQGLLNTLNGRLINIDPAKTLAAVCNRGAVLAVCGGPHKAAAIGHVLRRNPPWVSHLVTDYFVATYLDKEVNPPVKLQAQSAERHVRP